MRDAHRMKEKLDLSLDNRQIVSLVIAGIVVLGAVFVLGVVVGKQLATGDKTQMPADLLSALDDRAAAMQKVQKPPADPEVTFPDALTRKPEPEPSKPEPAKPPPAKAEAPKPEVAKAEPPKAEPVEIAEAPKAPEPKAETASKGAFTLQLSATQTRDEAVKFASGLKEKGYASFIVEAAVPGKGTWYRVRMGNFPTKDAANRYLQDFRRETRMEAFVAASE